MCREALARALAAWVGPLTRGKHAATVRADRATPILPACPQKSCIAGRPRAFPFAGETVHADYITEYSTDRIEMHTNAVQAGQRVVLVDDLIATGGTLRECCLLLLLAAGAPGCVPPPRPLLLAVALCFPPSRRAPRHCNPLPPG